MKKILICLLCILPLSLIAEVKIGGEIKAGATTGFSKRTEDAINDNGEDQEMETTFTLKGSIDDITSANIKMKATQYGLAGYDKSDRDTSERSYFFVDEAYFKSDIAKYLGLNNLFSAKLTAGLFRVEPLRLARMTQYKNEDISATEHYKANSLVEGKGEQDRVRINKVWNSPNIQLDIGLPVLTIRAGMSCHENTTTDEFEYLVGLYGRSGILNYEAFYYSDGGTFIAATDEEAAKTEFNDTIYGGVSLNQLLLGSVGIKTGVNYMYRLLTEQQEYGVGMSLTESSLIPAKLNLGLNGIINAEDGIDSLYDLSVDLTLKPSSLFKVQTGAVIDLREYDYAVEKPSALRIFDTVVTLTVKKTEIGLGYAHIFNENSFVQGDKARKTMFSYAEDGEFSHIYLNVKAKF